MTTKQEEKGGGGGNRRIPFLFFHFTSSAKENGFKTMTAVEFGMTAPLTTTST
jgi:hypothetical protein